MIKKQPYSKPPMVECDLEFKFKSAIEKQKIEKYAERIGSSYARKEPNARWHIEHKIDARAQELKSDAISAGKGYKFSSEDSTEILIVRTDVIIFSNLAPYSGWDVFIDRSIGNWDAFKKVVKKCPLERVGLRFVNRIDIPIELALAQNTKPVDYLNVYPSVPQIDSEISTYSINVELPPNEHNISARIISSSLPSPVPDSHSLLLDIDVFTAIDIPSNKHQFIEMLNRFRDYKNFLFETLITDKTRELIL